MAPGEPEVPVELRGNWRGVLWPTARTFDALLDPGMCFMHRPDGAGLDQFHYAAVIVGGVDLRSI